jgi:tRNA-dihydrouridine synthase B
MKIGGLELSGNVVLAPMAGITDPPFRRIVQRFGVSAFWTEMISADGIVVSGKTFPTMELDGHDIPTVFQIYGKDPSIMAEAARVLANRGAEALDLNMGCPSRRVVRRGAGAALMRDPLLAGRIVSAVRNAVEIPVSVKIRSGWDETSRNAPAVAKIVEDAGADAVVIHGRSRAKVHSGPACLSLIGQVKRSVRIPVIGNGGITSPEEAAKMLSETGCDGVMIGRGALGRPWLPGTILGTWSPGPGGMTFAEVIRPHYEDQVAWRGVPAGVRRMRKHLVWYSRGFPEAAAFRRTVLRLEDPRKVIGSIEEFFGKEVIS